MSTLTLDSILDSLAARRQRATYGAVAAVLASAPRVLMVGRPRDAHHSWIVSKTTGMPTGYPEDQLHPDLTANPGVLTNRDELLDWLGKVQ